MGHGGVGSDHQIQVRDHGGRIAKGPAVAVQLRAPVLDREIDFRQLLDPETLLQDSTVASLIGGRRQTPPAGALAVAMALPAILGVSLPVDFHAIPRVAGVKSAAPA